MDCDCIEEANAKLAEHNVKVTLTWYPVVRPLIETRKINPKKRGKKPPLLVATFCPFCGNPYEKEAA